MIRIHWPQVGKTIEISKPRPGLTILDVAMDNDIPLQHACGGFCACTTCHVKIKKGAECLSKMGEEEKDRLAGKGLLGTSPSTHPAERLGCQAQIESFSGDIEIEMGEL